MALALRFAKLSLASFSLLALSCTPRGYNSAQTQSDLLGKLECPAGYELKPINGNGGQLCTDGTNALGPFTVGMVKKCLEWGGGEPCSQERWALSLAKNAFGNGRCPVGATLDPQMQYCVEGTDAFGPFPKAFVDKCKSSGGGDACQKARWSSEFLRSILKDAGELNQDSAKPPQFVLLAFDGSKSITAWENTRKFSREMGASGINVKFTYFINAVYFMKDAAAAKYNGPGQGTGKSAIGFGGSAEDVKARMKQLNAAIEEGHAIESHSVGHWNGQSWTESQWNSEFNQFASIMSTLPAINGFTQFDFLFDSHKVMGFRAPELGRNDAMYKVLDAQSFRYDTSGVAPADDWPKKIRSVWSFPLAEIVTTEGKNTLSMDYNFYMAHSRAREDAANADRYQRDTYQTYMKYFKGRYEGSRAPLNIGHHFSQWNGGAYWKAMQQFAKEVCGKPEVRCVTYREYTNWLDSLPAATLASYRSGRFAGVPVAFEPGLPPLRESEGHFFTKSELENMGFYTDAPASHEEE